MLVDVPLQAGSVGPEVQLASLVSPYDGCMPTRIVGVRAFDEAATGVVQRADLARLPDGTRVMHRYILDPQSFGAGSQYVPTSLPLDGSFYVVAQTAWGGPAAFILTMES